jgi:hypothetical protein
MKTWDVFISHASEDKESFVRPLAEKLSEHVKVWYDEFTLTLGDSLRRSIDKGITNSRFGIVVLSKYFFEKEWPQKELDSLVTREDLGHKVLIPIWHDITRDEVASYSSLLADRKAILTSVGLEVIVKEILIVLNSTEDNIQSGEAKSLTQHSDKIQNAPKLTLKTTLHLCSTFQQIVGRPETYLYDAIFILSINNIGSSIAKYALLSIAVEHPYSISKYGLNESKGEDAKYGFPKTPTSVRSKWVTFQASGDDIIHPKDERQIAFIELKIPHNEKIQDLNFDYRLAAEGFSMVENHFTLMGEQIKADVLKLVPEQILRGK